MAKYQVFYQVYPNCPDATDLSKFRARISFYFSSFAGLLAIASVIIFAVCAFDLFSGFYWSDFLYALLFLISSAALSFYAFFIFPAKTDYDCSKLVVRNMLQNYPLEEKSQHLNKIKNKFKEEIINSAKKYWLFFCSGSVLLVGVIGIIQGIISLCSEQGGWILLVCSACGSVLTVVISLFLYSRSVNPRSRFSRNTTKSAMSPRAVSSSQINYCKKCGAKISSDSVFCSQCGHKL